MRQRRFNKKYVFVAVGTLCLISAVAAFAAYPKMNAIIKSRQELIACKEELDLCREAVTSIEEYNLTDKPVIAMLLARYKASLPAGELVPELVAEVRSACRAAGIRDVSIVTRRPELVRGRRTPAIVCDDGAFYRLPIGITGTGTYRGIAVLLNGLATGRRFIVARSLAIEEPEQSSRLARFQAETEAFCFLPADED